jgi:RNA recognition motif-containing protein
LKTTILQISNLPFKVTSEELLDWLGEEVKDSLPDPSQQIVSVHVLCDRFKGMTKWPAYVEVLDEKIAEKVKNEKWGKEFQGRKIKIAFSSRRAMLYNVCTAPFSAKGLSG